MAGRLGKRINDSWPAIRRRDIFAPGMEELPPADGHRLRAAQGWLELGDPQSAGEELEKITPEFQAHPVVLVIRFQVFVQAKQWDRAYEVADTLVQALSESGFGWLRRSQALHFMNRTQEAWEQLLPAHKKFPDNPFIAYDLACYACQLGHLQRALPWLARAFAGGEAQRLKLLTLEDPDLEPLWTNIGNL